MAPIARASLAFLLTLCCGSLAAQQPVEPPPENGSISGVVTDASSGEPLGKARIFLRKPDSRTQPQVTRSGPDGKFLLANIEPGRYRLSVERNRYARGEYGRRGPNRPGTTLTLQPGQDLGGVVFRLVRAGVIAGRIIDEDNEPMANVRIEAMGFRYFQGKPLTPARRGFLCRVQVAWLLASSSWMAASSSAEHAAADALLCQLAEPALDEIEPRKTWESK